MIFDNDNDEHRAQLIARLNQGNIPAYELNSGGWTMHVAATVIDTTADPPIIEVENQDLWQNSRVLRQMLNNIWRYLMAVYQRLI